MGLQDGAAEPRWRRPHQWILDRITLRARLTQLRFPEPEMCQSDTSSTPQWSDSEPDRRADGRGYSENPFHLEKAEMVSEAFTGPQCSREVGLDQTRAAPYSISQAMSVETQIQWQRFFRAAGTVGESARFTWRVLRKQRHAFLYLPENSRFARHAITLYPAQTRMARTARFALGVALRLHLPVVRERDQWSASAEDEFLEFMAGLAGLPPTALPTPAVLAGYPKGPGPRCLFLVDSGKATPAAVVKAGSLPAARQLIQAEVDILSKLPARLPGIPRTLATFTSARVEALAQEYVAGDSPRTHDPHRIAAILTSWIGNSRTVRLSEIPAWQRLAAVCGTMPHFAKLTGRLAHCTVHPVLYHGDFTPWNIKVSRPDRRWIMLDWERGDVVGIPGWDWFHYIIQHDTLVRRLTVEKLITDVEGLLASEPFQAYAQQAGISGIARDLALGYALYDVTVHRPYQTLEFAKQLVDGFTTRWRLD